MKVVVVVTAFALQLLIAKYFGSRDIEAAARG